MFGIDIYIYIYTTSDVYTDTGSSSRTHTLTYKYIHRYYIHIRYICIYIYIYNIYPIYHRSVYYTDMRRDVETWDVLQEGEVRHTRDSTRIHTHFEYLH